MIGTLMRQKICHWFAPSMTAASYREGLMLAKAAMKISIGKAAYCQMLDPSTEYRVRLGFPRNSVVLRALSPRSLKKASKQAYLGAVESQEEIADSDRRQQDGDVKDDPEERTQLPAHDVDRPGEHEAQGSCSRQGRSPPR